MVKDKMVKDKVEAFDWVVEQGATISIHYDEVSDQWTVEDIIDNVFTGKTLFEAVQKASAHADRFGGDK